MTPAPRVAPVWPVERSPVVLPMASAAALAVYALGIPALVSVGFIETRTSWTWVSIVLLAISVYSGVRLAFELGKGASRWFVLAFHTFTYVFLGVVPLVQVGARTLLWTADPAPDVLVATAVICLAGVLLFDVGLWFGLSLPTHGRRRRVGPFARREEQPDPQSELEKPQSDGFPVRAADRALAFLLGLSVLSVVLFIMRGGLALVFASQSEMNAALCSVQSSGGLAECGVVSALVRVPPVILTVVALGLRHKGHRSLTRLAIIAGIISLLLTANPVSAGRFWVGAVTIGVLGAALFRSHHARVLIWLALPLLLLLLFPRLDFGRNPGWSADFSINLDTLTQKQDFDAFQQIANGVTYVDVYGTRGGMQLSSALLFFVPRSVWSAKAPATGSLVSASLGITDNTNVSSPVWEEAYVDFGFGGVLVMLSALGFAVARLEAAVQESLLRRSGLTVIVAPFFAGYGVFLLRGPLLSAVGILTGATMLVWAISRLGCSPEKSSGLRSTTNGNFSPPVRFLRAAPNFPRDRIDGLISPVGTTAICESEPRVSGSQVRDA